MKQHVMQFESAPSLIRVPDGASLVDLFEVLLGPEELRRQRIAYGVGGIGVEASAQTTADADEEALFSAWQPEIARVAMPDAPEGIEVPTIFSEVYSAAYMQARERLAEKANQATTQQTLASVRSIAA